MISALFTDRYELNMAEAWRAERMTGIAVFEVAYRRLPANRDYILAAGLADVLKFLSEFRFSPEDLTWLRMKSGLSESFIEFLEGLRFTGDVYAVPEGTPVFPNEPLLQVRAPIIEAQLVETAILNAMHFQSLVLTKAARMIKAAKGRMVVDFGSRRAPGVDAALSGARAFYMAGGYGTSNVLAARKWGIPAFGTMAHSYIQAHESEAGAFEAFASLFPAATFLVDTYDSLEGVRLVADLRKHRGNQFRVDAVRLDSGDLAALARESRRILDEAGLHDVTIFASSGLDEYEIARLVDSGAPIDGFGVGTKLAVCADAPELDMAYKLVEYAGKGCCKLSPNKIVYPGPKQVFRDNARDMIGRVGEKLPGVALLRPAMLAGRIQPQPTLAESRAQLRRQLAQLPSAPYPVGLSQSLRDDLESLREEHVLEGALR